MHTFERPGPARAGFTLIELLVVVAIIGLLMSLLLPAMSQAREQAKTVKCNSNLRQLGVAMHMYFNDEGEWFPFWKHSNGSPGYMHAVYFGGHPGREDWWGYNSLGARDTPAGRPFNRYLYPDLPDWDVPPEDPAFEMVRDLPLYECPSDTGGLYVSQDTPESPWDSQYRNVGTSYLSNYQFVRYWAGDWWQGKIGFGKPNPWLYRANAFLQVQLRYHASRFVIIYEDPFNWSLWQHLPIRGWHKRWNTHNMLYLDGHAAATYADTLEGNEGVGWKTAAGNKSTDRTAFWNNEDDPDFRHRLIAPLPRKW